MSRLPLPDVSPTDTFIAELRAVADTHRPLTASKTKASRKQRAKAFAVGALAATVLVPVGLSVVGGSTLFGEDGRLTGVASSSEDNSVMIEGGAAVQDSGAPQNGSSQYEYAPRSSALGLEKAVLIGARIALCGRSGTEEAFTACIVRESAR